MSQRSFDRFLLHAVGAVILALVLYAIAALWIAAHAAPPCGKTDGTIAARASQTEGL